MGVMIRAEMFEHGGHAGMQLAYRGPDTKDRWRVMNARGYNGARRARRRGPVKKARCGRTSKICMGDNLRCMRTTLAKCKVACKRNRRCLQAEYTARGRHCCLSRHSTRATCRGRWSSAGGWVGYN